MRIVNLEQNTPQWLEWRRGRLMASDAGSAAGDGYKTWPQLKETQRGVKEEITDKQREMFDHGHKMEDHVKTLPPLDRFEATVMETDDGVHGASLDGWYNETVLEVKAPFNLHNSRIWKQYEEHMKFTNQTMDPAIVSECSDVFGVAPPYIAWQLVQQSFISQCKEIIYAICMGEGIVYLTKIPGVSAQIHWHALKQHWENYVEWRDNFDNLEQAPFARYIVAEEVYKKVKEEYDAAKKDLLAHTGETAGSVVLFDHTVTINRNQRTNRDWRGLALTLMEGMDRVEADVIIREHTADPTSYSTIRVRETK